MAWLWLQSFPSLRWQVCRAPVCKSSIQLDWADRRGQVRFHHLFSSSWIDGLQNAQSSVHCTSHLLQKIFFSPHLPCLMKVVTTPKDSHQHGFWTSRWAALWQSRLPVCLAVPEYWNWSRHCPTVCYQRGKTLLSLQYQYQWGWTGITLMHISSNLREGCWREEGPRAEKQISSVHSASSRLSWLLRWGWDRPVWVGLCGAKEIGQYVTSFDNLKYGYKKP